jgi:Na+/H+ antiporter
MRVRSSLRWGALLGATVVVTSLLASGGAEWRVLWPPVLALATVVVLRRVTFGLLLGAWSGVVLMNGGNWLTAIPELVGTHLLPNFTSSWKIGALLFTLLLGGFAALLEAGGGLQSLVVRFLRRGDPRRHLQLATIGLGFVCFFDGLANSVLLGRVTRSLADGCRVSREKLAYLVDSTSSAVACIAFISTWIATQLTLIREGLTAVGREADFPAYGVFFASIPLNFYVLFTLALLLVVVLSDWDFGPMRRAENAARRRSAVVATPDGQAVPAWTALVPLGVLVLGILGLFYGWEARPLWPPTWERTAMAFSSADGAWLLVIGSVIGVAAAWVCYPRTTAPRKALPVFAGGVGSLIVPLGVLIAAWVLGSVIAGLGTAAYAGRILEGRLPVALLPAAVFVTGAFISFTTGTSWGTMGLLMPLAVPLVFSLGGHANAPLGEGELLSAVVAAVFSGAVFGDHCSPFSDTTIVSAVATGVSTFDHTRTQLPYALLAAGVAIAAGFVPAGAGWMPAWGCALAGLGILVATGVIGRRLVRAGD